LNVENECGKGQVGYFADTMGGSSGAPVVGSSDNQVIALHHCGGCQNVAYSTKKILDHVELEFKKKKMSLPTCWTHAKTAGGLAGDSDAKKRRSGDGGKKQTIDLSALFPPAKQPTTGGGEAPVKGGAALTSEDHAEATKKHHVQNPPLTGDAATYAVDAPPCSETGNACPKAYAEPIGGCYPGVINSPTGCVVPEDAICMQAPSPQDGGSIYYKCVFPSVGC
ncbi:hypothetical protein DYB28_015486, partial [Aphanomyces astaci]